ncbi:hypothetical protein ACOBV8_21310 (plasmid) [Pseudoalteromonas espejiana]
MGASTCVWLGLNAIDVMSFYYLFIPTWFFFIVVYAACKYGAGEDYTKEIAAEEQNSKTIKRIPKQSLLKMFKRQWLITQCLQKY